MLQRVVDMVQEQEQEQEQPSGVTAAGDGTSMDMEPKKDIQSMALRLFEKDSEFRIYIAHYGSEFKIIGILMIVFLCIFIVGNIVPDIGGVIIRCIGITFLNVIYDFWWLKTCEGPEIIVDTDGGVSKYQKMETPTPTFSSSNDEQSCAV